MAYYNQLNDVYSNFLMNIEYSNNPEIREISDSRHVRLKESFKTQMARLIQSTREILDIHNNLLFQWERINRQSVDVHSFLSIFSLFISLLSPYVYYSAVLTLCCNYLNALRFPAMLTPRKMTSTVFAHFVEAYSRVGSSTHTSTHVVFDVLATPIKRVEGRGGVERRSCSTCST